MEIRRIRRPWEKSKPKAKTEKEPFYQSSLWKRVRKAFINERISHLDLKPIAGIRYRNLYCADCWEKGTMNDQRIEVDHVIAIKDGGSPTDHSNLRSRCHAHHNSKTHAERKVRGK
jgi:hypothetical protein